MARPKQEPRAPGRRKAARALQTIYEQGKTPEYVAKKLGVSVATIWRWAHDLHEPHPGALSRLEQLAERAERLVAGQSAVKKSA